MVTRETEDSSTTLRPISECLAWNTSEMREKCQFSVLHRGNRDVILTQRNIAKLLSMMELGAKLKLRTQLMQPFRQNPADNTGTCVQEAFCLRRLQTRRKKKAQFNYL